MNVESKPFSSGTEYEIFKYNFCERCRKHKESENGFPAFPEDGGCQIEDAMENARFDISLFPSESIRKLTSANDSSVLAWHYCIEFHAFYKDVQNSYLNLMKKALFKEADG